jgi:hypothetical protein
VRLSAAEQLSALDSRAAAQACVAITSDKGVRDEVRLSAGELLAAAAAHRPTAYEGGLGQGSTCSGPAWQGSTCSGPAWPPPALSASDR